MIGINLSAVTIIRAVAAGASAAAGVVAVFSQGAFERRGEPLGGFWKGTPFETYRATPYGIALLTIIVLAPSIQLFAELQKDKADDKQLSGYLNHTASTIDRVITDSTDESMVNIKNAVNSDTSKAKQDLLTVVTGEATKQQDVARSIDKKTASLFDNIERDAYPFSDVRFSYSLRLPALASLRALMAHFDDAFVKAVEDHSPNKDAVISHLLGFGANMRLNPRVPHTIDVVAPLCPKFYLATQGYLDSEGVGSVNPAIIITIFDPQPKPIGKARHPSPQVLPSPSDINSRAFIEAAKFRAEIRTADENYTSYNRLPASSIDPEALKADEDRCRAASVASVRYEVDLTNGHATLYLDTENIRPQNIIAPQGGKFDSQINSILDLVNTSYAVETLEQNQLGPVNSQTVRPGFELDHIDLHAANRWIHMNVENSVAADRANYYFGTFPSDRKTLVRSFFYETF